MHASVPPPVFGFGKKSFIPNIINIALKVEMQFDWPSLFFEKDGLTYE
jgi:hypothetical protein